MNRGIEDVPKDTWGIDKIPAESLDRARNVIARFYAEKEGMKAAQNGNWPRVVFWAKRWLKPRGD